MIRHIKAYVEQNNLLTKGDRIVVGVSGGADSICLLHVLKQLIAEYELFLIVVHINHGIRGEEADQDELFVKNLCSREGLEFRSMQFNIPELADSEGLSEEEAGRKVRYEAFFEVCKEKQCNKIAIAHNRNDNAETVLFNLFRGSGIRGISGIEANRSLRLENGEITLIRPLLEVTRADIEEYLSREMICYRTDSSNLSDDYSRNKIRNHILTYATKEINQQSIGNITEAAKSLREIEDYLNGNIQERYHALIRVEFNVYRVSIQDLLAEHIVIQKGLLRLIMEALAGARKDLEAKHVDSVLSLLHKQVGKRVNLPYNIIAEREYEGISLYQAIRISKEHLLQEAFVPVTLMIPGRTELIGAGKCVETELFTYKNSDSIPKSSCAKWFDYDKIENAVEIRTRREGDYLQVNESGGRKKLKDYFIDHKIPQKERDKQLLITDGSHVMWIPETGDRMSERYKVDASTTKVLLIKMSDMEVNKDGL
jgi:tRNA(Ile)-lysidine synthase